MIKDHDSELSVEMRRGKDGLRHHHHFAGPGMEGCKREEFTRGYREGFDKAIEVLAASAWRMDHPPARLAIAELVVRLERTRYDLHEDERHGSRFLKQRRYALS